MNLAMIARYRYPFLPLRAIFLTSQVPLASSLFSFSCPSSASRVQLEMSSYSAKKKKRKAGPESRFEQKFLEYEKLVLPLTLDGLAGLSSRKVCEKTKRECPKDTFWQSVRTKKKKKKSNQRAVRLESPCRWLFQLEFTRHWWSSQSF